jgi:hypothetical protein
MLQESPEDVIGMRDEIIDSRMITGIPNSDEAGAPRARTT